MKKLLLGIALLGVGVVLLGFILPSKWKVERSIVINAPPEKIYPLVANFKNGWGKWSAFDYADPSIQYAYSGPEEGAGATRAWISKKMGDGTQTITNANKQYGIEFSLEMQKPACAIRGQIAFKPSGKATQVTWTDTGDVGPNPLKHYMAAAMDRMMGKIFETSLAALKKEAEAVVVKKK